MAVEVEPVTRWIDETKLLMQLCRQGDASSEQSKTQRVTFVYNLLAAVDVAEHGLVRALCVQLVELLGIAVDINEGTDDHARLAPQDVPNFTDVGTQHIGLQGEPSSHIVKHSANHFTRIRSNMKLTLYLVGMDVAMVAVHHGLDDSP